MDQAHSGSPVAPETKKSLPLLLADRVHRATEWFAASLLLAMAAVILYQVFCRYILRDSPAWSEEIAILCMIWFAFLGIAVGVRNNLHIAIEFVVNLFPAALRRAAALFAAIMVLGFGILLIVFGTIKILGTSHSLPGTGLPGMTPYVAAPIAGLMIAVQSIRNMIVKE